MEAMLTIDASSVRSWQNLAIKATHVAQLRDANVV
jgi:hypothetical protein